MKGVAVNDKIRKALAALGARPDDAPLDLAEAALLLAGLDHPRTDLAPYRAHLALLAREAADEAGAGRDHAETQGALLADLLAARHGYRGDNATYDAPENADLIRVIDRRQGLPVALGILWLHAGRAAGFVVEGLNFPGHFLLRLRASASAVILDPFNGGRRVETAEMRALLKRMMNEDRLTADHHRAVSDREVILRLLNNQKSRALQAGDLDRAADILERSAMLAPRYGAGFRELGLVRADQGRFGDAIAALERLVALARDGGDAAARAAAESLLAQIRAKLN